jgi:hypothetical protein
MATKEDMINRAEADYKKWREDSGDYQSRFCFELVELRDRVSRLDNFLQNKPLPDDLDKDIHRKNLLQLQLQIMRSYLEVLKMRYDNDRL